MTSDENILSSLGNSATASRPPPAGYTVSERQTVCGDIDMRIDREGLWHYLGSPIGRINLVKLFSTVLKRDDDGDHWLITPVEICHIEVEDAAFMAVEMYIEGTGQNQNLKFRTNIDKEVSLNSENPLWIRVDLDTKEPRPYIILDGGLEARLTRAVFYELVALGQIESIKGAESIDGSEKRDGNDVFGVWSHGDFFPLGELT